MKLSVPHVLGPRRASALAVGLSLLLGASLAVSLNASPADARPARHAKPAPALVFGVAMPGVPDDLTGLATVTTELGQAPGSVVWYDAWSRNADFPTDGARRIAATGAVPEITWEPWDPALGTDQPAYALDRITAGDFDGYLTRWARQIRAYRQPVVVRFAHEMNGNWYPWSEQVNGNGPGDSVAAWRHVVQIFTANHAGNVIWKWSPNVPYEGSTDLASLYPGDRYVDQVALDGYNWSTLQPWSTWQSFAEIFAPGLAQLRALTARPVYIGETGCPEIGGDKAAWVSDMFATLRAHPEIRGLTWFDFDKETDWRLDSSAPTLAAFRAGL